MYAKLFASLYQGTLRGQSNEILVFTNLLAHTSKDGVVDKHFRAIAEETGLPMDAVKAAIERLESPDPESRSPEEGGARIVRVDDHRAWGWRVVNHGKYRAIRSEAERAEQNRLAQARWRQRKQSKPPSAEDKHDKPIQSQMQSQMQKAEPEAAHHLSPPRPPPPAKPPKERASDRAYKFADWFRLTLPPTAKPSPSWREQWAKTFDDLVRLDSRDPAEIERVAEWGRKDGFWAANFLSPAKLRQRDKAGTLFFDRFVAAMAQKRTNGNLTPAEQKEKREAGTFRLDPKSEAAKRRVWRPPNTPCVPKTVPAEPPAETKSPI